MNLFFIDIETTGHDAKKHEIIELAFAIIINGVIHCKMELFMRPEKWDTISQDALKINGWSIEKLKRLPLAGYGLSMLLLTMNYHYQFGRFKIVEYSNRFDRRFIENIMKPIECNMHSFFQNESINVLSLAKKKFPKLENHKLKTVARRFGVPVDEKQLHGAGYDRDLLIEVYRKFGGRL